MERLGRQVRGTGGRHSPPVSTLRGSGLAPALLDKTESWAEKSCLSEWERKGNMFCSRKVMCRVEAEWEPIFLLVPTSSCRSWTCKAGQPCVGEEEEVRSME